MFFVLFFCPEADTHCHITHIKNDTHSSGSWLDGTEARRFDVRPDYWGRRVLFRGGILVSVQSHLCYLYKLQVLN